MDELRLECHKKLMSLSWKLIRKSRLNLNQMGFAWNTFSVMNSIVPGESVTISEISSRTSKENSNVTAIIDSLEGKGIFRRVNDKNDRRVIRVELTEDGVKLRNEVNEKHNAFIKSMFIGVPEELLMEFNRVVDNMLEYF